MNLIPVMDDPLGRYWEQPSDIRWAEMDDTHVILSPRQLGELHKYDTSMPSGVYPGKCWARRQSNGTLLVWYGPDTGGQCAVLFRKILVME